MDKKIRIGILGCANIAEKYSIKAFQQIDNAEVISIASRDQEKARDWASRFGIKAEDSYDTLIHNPAIDAVYIPLPVGLHKEWILKAAAAKKHVIAEKSLAESLASVKESVSAFQKNGVVLYENFMCDFHPQHQAVLDLMQDGKIGKPFIFRGSFGRSPFREDNIRTNKDLGGGVLNDMGCYTVFMARKILGSEPKAVTCTLSYDTESGVDNNGVAFLEFDNDVSAEVAFSFDAVYQNNYSLWGSEGLIKVERAYSIPSNMKPEVKFIKNDGGQETSTDLDIPAANNFELIFNDFCDTILNQERMNDKIGIIYSNLINQAKVLEAMRVSSVENRKVKLEEIS